LRHALQLYEGFWIENVADFLCEHYTKRDNHRDGCGIPELTLLLDNLNGRYQGAAYLVISRDETIEEVVQRYAPGIKAYMRLELLNEFPWLNDFPQLTKEPTAPDRRRWHTSFKEEYERLCERVEKERQNSSNQCNDFSYQGELPRRKSKSENHNI